MRQPIPLRAALLAGTRAHGVLLPLPAPFVIDVAAAAGIQFLVFDLEHGISDTSVVAQHVALARAAGVEPFARIHPGELASASRLLDLGIAGLMLPAVDSAAAARSAVGALRFPPLGERGFATGSAAGRHGTRSATDVIECADAETYLVAMIESPEGVDDAAAIAAVPGIDALFVGRADLAVALGVPGRVDDQRVRDAVERVRDAAHAAGRAFLDTGAPAAKGAHAGPPLHELPQQPNDPQLHNVARLLFGALDSAVGSGGPTP
jgi:4-hydroxy-2-oxoheptanedioate aldolase